MISGNLFTRDYLLEGITRTEAWKALTPAQVEDAKKRLSKLAKSLQAINKPNEAQTEKTFIYPVLDVVGWADVEVQQTLSTRGRKQVPDAVLFGDTASRDLAVAEQDHWKRYKYGLAVVEAKRWKRLLDRADKRDADEEGVPSTQMLQYLSRVDVQTSSKVRLGILTNGVKWRLYFQGALSVSEDFFEIDLAKVLELPGHDLDLFDQGDARLTRDHCLRLFILMFGKPAFLPVDGQRTFHDISREVGKVWEEKVTKDLSALVFNQLFPMLVAALAKHDKQRPKNITPAYLEDVRQSALVLLYRLLFVVYAEDRDLLPDRQEPYKSYSLTTMRLDIADRISKGQVFSASLTTYWPKLAAVFEAIAEGNDELGIPPYNGGLFAKDSAPILARIALPDAVMSQLVFKLSHREEEGTARYINYRDLTVQQLGTIYERTLEYGLKADGDMVVVDADDTARHESGSYYTPDSLVSLIIEKAVGPFVDERLAAFREKALSLAKDKRQEEIKLAELQGSDPALAILELKICDPAMGSGHFLVNLVDWLADKALAAIGEAELIVDWSEKPYRSPVLASIEQTRTDIIRQATVHKWPFVVEHLDDRHVVRRTVLKRCIYGVDKNPMAVELAKVALWLHTFTVGAPLSFLDHHLRCGNSLFGYWVKTAMERLTKWGGQLLINEPMQKAMAQAIAMQKLERVNDIDIGEVHQSKTLFDGIEQETRPLNSFMKVLYALDWLKLDKAAQSAVKAWLDGQFGDPFEIARGKFRLGPTDEGDGHPEAKDVLDRIPVAMRKDAVRFASVLNEARTLVRSEKFQNWQVSFPGVWRDWSAKELAGGFHAVVGNPPYVRQELIKPIKPALKRAYPDTYDGSADLYVYFYDQGLTLLQPGGRLSYVVTNKWMRAAYAEGLRGVFADKAWIEFVADFGHAKKFFPDADVFPSVLVIRKPTEAPGPATTEVCVIPRDDVPEKALDEAVAKAIYPLPRSHFTRESWTLETPDVVALLNKIKCNGTPLTEVAGVKPYRGVLTGFNEAFLIDTPTRDRLIAEDSNAADIIKPYLRGQDVQRWNPAWQGLWMIFARRGINIDAYPSIKRHLTGFRAGLEPKPANWEPEATNQKWPGRKEGAYAWYEIQDAIDYWQEFSKPKIVYQEIQFHPAYAYDSQGLFSNNKTFILTTDAMPLLAVLNSPLMWWFNWRYLPHMKDEALSPMGFKMETLPIARFDGHAHKEATDISTLLIARTASQKSVAEAVQDWLKHAFGIEKPKGALSGVTGLDADEFVTAVAAALPKKQKLTAADISELKREHTATIQPARRVRAEIFSLERRLADLVNDAYGLSEEDVQLMWRTAPPRMPFTPQGLSNFQETADGEEDE